MKKMLIMIALLTAWASAAQQTDSVAPVWDVTRPNSKTESQMNAMTRMVEGSEVFRSDTKTVWRYVDSAWVNTGSSSFTGDASEIANGSVSNAEFQRLDGATAPVLTQANVVDNVVSTSTVSPLSANQGVVLKGLIDAKGSGDVTAASAFGTDNRLIRSDGTGKGVQSSGIAVNDSDNISGVGSFGASSLNISGNIVGGGSISTTGTITGGILEIDDVEINDLGTSIYVQNSVAHTADSEGRFSILDSGQGIYFGSFTLDNLSGNGTGFVGVDNSGNLSFSAGDGTGTDDQTADEVTISDAGGYTTETEVEGAIQDIYSILDNTAIGETLLNSTRNVIVGDKDGIVSNRTTNGYTQTIVDNTFAIGDALYYINHSTGSITISYSSGGGTVNTVLDYPGASVTLWQSSLNDWEILSEDNISVADTPTTVLTLDNPLGRYSNMGSANSATTYTTSGTTTGAFVKVLINAASQPSVTGGTLVTGATFAASTDMFMIVYHNGTEVEYFFLEK